jgi:hypothetical protein
MLVDYTTNIGVCGLKYNLRTFCETDRGISMLSLLSTIFLVIVNI